LIRNLKYSEIDFEKYNSCLHNSLNYKVFAEKWYLDAVTNLPWNCLVYDNYKAIMPLPFRKKFGFKYVAQPLFTQQLGVFYKEEISQAIFDDFFKILDKYWVRSYCFNHHNTVNFKIKGKLQKNYALDLNSTDKQLFAKFRKGTKAEVKVAEREGVVLQNCTNIEDIAHLNESFSNYKISPIFRKTFSSILKQLQNKNQLLMYVSNLNNEKVGYICMIINEKSIHYLFSSVSMLGKRVGVSHFQIFNIMKQYSNQETVFDFLGSEIPGVAKFFRSFGAEEKKYTYYSSF